MREDHFHYDALGNRYGANYLGSRGQWMDFARKDNGLNQYRMWSPFSVTNYDDDIGGWGSPGHANGVLMQEGNITAGYNALNQPMLASSSSLSPNWMFFGYDPLGRCVKRWNGQLVNGSVPPPASNPATYYYYDGWNLIQEGPATGGIVWDGSNVVGGNTGGAARAYVHGARTDELVASVNMYNLQLVYHQYDELNNTSMLTSDGGAIMEQYFYDAFGWPYVFDGGGGYYATNSPFGNRFLFQGREFMSDLKLYDYRNRLYQPEPGRFMQPDPKHFGAGDYNLYRYCHNDPVNKVDPFGFEEDSRENLAKRALIDKIARSKDGNQDYRQDVAKGAFEKGANKCNQFVGDVTKAAGAPMKVVDADNGKGGCRRQAKMPTRIRRSKIGGSLSQMKRLNLVT